MGNNKRLCTIKRQRDWSLGPCDLKSGGLTTRQPARFNVLDKDDKVFTLCLEIS